MITFAFIGMIVGAIVGLVLALIYMGGLALIGVLGVKALWNIVRDWRELL